MILLSWLFLLTILFWVTEIPWMFLLISLASVFALLLKLQIKYKGHFILKRKKEGEVTTDNRSWIAALYSCVWSSSTMFADLIFPPQLSCSTDETPPVFFLNLPRFSFWVPSAWSAVILLIQNLKRKMRILSYRRLMQKIRGEGFYC